MRAAAHLSMLVSTLAVAVCGASARQDGRADGFQERLLAAPANGNEWLSTGRTYDEQRHSPLDKITDGNVASLGLAWFADLDTARGQEATPLAIDSMLYTSTAWSMVKAYDGRTGQELWSFDPEVPRETLVKACCDAVNRGVAAWDDKLFVGSLDGRLIALDRKTGRPLWSVVTVDQSKPYTITGAPRVIKGTVIIGNGGSEFGVRGYVTAYDARDGHQLWRFYTVPGDPAKGFEGPHLKTAATTWKGAWWKLGGGGTVWDSMAYDPALDLLYIGVGNGSPWNQAIRSPGGGDNLYLSSIVAIRPGTGEYVWHYQTTPGETWDYTATQHIVLADIPIDGKVRKVLMQAPKNGYFYVLDRADGKLISANAYAPMNWSTGIDMATGRPIENPQARYDKTGKPWISVPGAAGAHSWHPMSFDPKSRLVYIPMQDAGYPYFPQAGWKPAALGYNTGTDLSAGSIPADTKARADALDSVSGALIAWDPVAGKEVWRAKHPGAWNGGVLSTSGNLVFQGTAAGRFEAYRADNGKLLWSTEAQTGILAAPITYSIAGEQYVAVMAGWGGVWALAPGVLSAKSGPIRNVSRLLVYKLGGTAKLPPLPPAENLPFDPPAPLATAAQRTEGKYLFGRFCGACHGDSAIAGSLVPDLRHSAVLEDATTWRDVVIGGALQTNGMVSFASVLSPAQAESVRQFVIVRANEDRALMVGNQSGKR